VILLAGFLHLSVIFFRKLKKIQILSYTLASVIVIFALILGFELYQRNENGEVKVNINDVLYTKADESHLFSSLSMVILSLSIHQLTFTTYVELESRTTERFIKASSIALVASLLLVMLIGVSGVLLFGSKIDADFLMNLRA